MKIIVIGTSAGGAEALLKLVRLLPSGFTTPILIVWHLSPASRNTLPKILGKNSKMPVKSPSNGENIRLGTIYVAPSDHHLIVDDGRMRVVHGPKENRFRPAIDPLFRSAAFTYGPNAIGILLTGMLNDGTAGLWAIKDRRGITIVQDPLEAQFPEMPLNALDNVDIDYKVNLEELPSLLQKLATQPDKPDVLSKPEKMGIEIKMSTDRRVNDTDVKRLGELSEFTCPECQGSLWKIGEGNVIRFRCRTGHAFTAEALLEGLSEEIEKFVWQAIKALEENTSLIKYLSSHLHNKSAEGKKEIYLKKADESQHLADILRDLLTKKLID